MDSRNLPDGKRLVILSSDGWRVHVEPPPPAALPRPPTVPPPLLWLFFTPVELEIVRLLTDTPSLKAAAVLSRLPDESESKVKFALAGLVERRVLICTTTDGYGLNVNDDERAELRAWLAERRVNGSPPLNHQSPAGN